MLNILSLGQPRSVEQDSGSGELRQRRPDSSTSQPWRHTANTWKALKNMTPGPWAQIFRCSNGLGHDKALQEIRVGSQDETLWHREEGAEPEAQPSPHYPLRAR